MSVSFNPIGPWPLVLLAAAVVTVLTIWAYRIRLRGSTGRWRWVALGLRLLAVLLCVLAALRPSVVVSEKKNEAASLVVMLDSSMSMRFNDEVRGRSRWEVARQTLEEARGAVKSLPSEIEVQYYQFDSTLREDGSPAAKRDQPGNPGENPAKAEPKPAPAAVGKPADPNAQPEGRESAIGTVLLEAIKRQAGRRVAMFVLLSDGASNTGVPPLVAAQQLRGQDAPVVAVGFGSENAGTDSRDISVKDLAAGPTVFVKNKLEARGLLDVRGFPNLPLEVELWVEGENRPVSTTQVTAKEGVKSLAVSGLSYVPSTPGEKKVTLKVKPEAGELIQTNNEFSTFLTVLKGGLNVLYIQGPNFSWDPRYVRNALDASPDIQVDYKLVRRPATGGVGLLPDSDFARGRYDVYVLGDIPADHLTATQQKMLADSVEKGAGLIMLGGRSSFGAGGWASTEVARVLPVQISPNDGQLEPEGGIPVVPNADGLESYVLRLASSRAESAQIWQGLPPITGTNRFGAPKPTAIVLAQAPDREPLIVGLDIGQGRTLAFGGETWVWARGSDEGRQAHRKFWRQAIFWLAHKEDQGDNEVKLTLDRRRVAAGQKLELSVTARDSKGEPIPDVRFEASLAPDEGSAAPEKVDVFGQGEEARGVYFATAKPGDYRVTVRALRNGQEIGRDSARFLIYQDDRELENPAADLALLRQLAEASGGTFLPPEQLSKHLRSMNTESFTEYVQPIERRIWDNWPFFLIFLAVLTVEWWLRKRHGWV